MALESPLTLVDALTQSRHRILHDALPLLKSTKSSRNKEHSLSFPYEQTSSQAPYELQHIITTTIIVGPHSFSDTKLYRVDWRSSSEGMKSTSTSTSASTSTSPAATATTTAMKTAETTNAASARIDTAVSEAATASVSAPLPDTDTIESTPLRRPGLAIRFKELSSDTYILPPHFYFESGSGSTGPMLSFWLLPHDRRNAPSSSASGNHQHPVPFTLIFGEALSNQVDNKIQELTCNSRERTRVDAWSSRMATLIEPRMIITNNHLPPPGPPAFEPSDFSTFIPVATKPSGKHLNAVASTSSRLIDSTTHSKEGTPLPSLGTKQKRAGKRGGRGGGSRGGGKNSRGASRSASVSVVDTPDALVVVPEKKKVKKKARTSVGKPVIPKIENVEEVEVSTSRSGRVSKRKSFGEEFGER